tara:strand:- start:2439 stop:2984 length:546 start_codon:yes stop_codon:yes gene_type:complete
MVADDSLGYARKPGRRGKGISLEKMTAIGCADGTVAEVAALFDCGVGTVKRARSAYSAIAAAESHYKEVIACATLRNLLLSIEALILTRLRWSDLKWESTNNTFGTTQVWITVEGAYTPSEPMAGVVSVVVIHESSTFTFAYDGGELRVMNFDPSFDVDHMNKSGIAIRSETERLNAACSV